MYFAQTRSSQTFRQKQTPSSLQLGLVLVKFPVEVSAKICYPICPWAFPPTAFHYNDKPLTIPLMLEEFEDENIDSEFIGVAQRRRQLDLSEATRKEIAGLRGDMRRREAEEKAAPKCPYCSGAISGGAVKCRHCAGDIKWYFVHGQSYQLRADENVERFVARKTKEEILQEGLKRTEKANEAKRILTQKPESIAEAVTGFVILLVASVGLPYALYKSYWPLFDMGLILFLGGTVLLAFGSLFAICGAFSGFIRLFYVELDNAKLLEDKKGALVTLKMLEATEISIPVAGTPINCPICDSETNVVYFPWEQMTLCEHCSESFVIPASSR